MASAGAHFKHAISRIEAIVPALGLFIKPEKSQFLQAPGVSGATEKADTSLLECSHGEGGNNIYFLVGSEEVTQI